MPLTSDQIVEEASRWPREKVAELVDRLSLALQQTTDPAINSAWKSVVRRRLAEIENGQVNVVPGEQVSAKIRKVVGR